MAVVVVIVVVIVAIFVRRVDTIDIFISVTIITIVSLYEKLANHGSRFVTGTLGFKTRVASRAPFFHRFKIRFSSFRQDASNDVRLEPGVQS